MINSSRIPFLLHFAERRAVDGEVVSSTVSEDPIPAVVEVDAKGFLATRGTRETKVHAETTDDI